MAWEGIKTQTVWLSSPWSQPPCAAWAPDDQGAATSALGCRALHFFNMFLHIKPQACLSLYYSEFSIVGCQAYAYLIHSPNWFSCLQALVQTVPSARNGLSLHTPLAVHLSRRAASQSLVWPSVSQAPLLERRGHFPSIFCTHKT